MARQAPPTAEDKHARLPLWSASDTARLARLPADCWIAWQVSDASWERVAHRRAARRAADPDRKLEASVLATLLGDHTRIASAAEGVVAGGLAASELRWFQALRCHHPAGWSPTTAVHGLAPVEAALARGRGAVLWFPSLAFASLAGKASLAQAGLRVFHLSQWFHGPSRSRLGVRIFNRLQQTAESRFLVRRVVMRDGPGRLAANREIVRLLRTNEVVSITAGAAGARSIEVPFFRGTIRVAAGAVWFAKRANSPVFACFTTRCRGAAKFVTRIEPLHDPAEAPARSADAVVADLARRLERYAISTPEQVFWRQDFIAKISRDDV